jgi:uncharacterized protein (TIGR02611 family)
MTAAERLRERRERNRRRPLVVRAAIVIAGFAALGGGALLLVLPGPGIPLVAAGLGLLSLEFRWAEALLQFVLRRTARVRPRKRSHRIAATVVMVAALAASLTIAVLFGVPGF